VKPDNRRGTIVKGRTIEGTFKPGNLLPILHRPGNTHSIGGMAGIGAIDKIEWLRDNPGKG
jgi:hypothetical protein